MYKITTIDRASRETNTYETDDPEKWIAENGYAKWERTHRTYYTLDMEGWVETIVDIYIDEGR